MWYLQWYSGIYSDVVFTVVCDIYNIVLLKLSGKIHLRAYDTVVWYTALIRFEQPVSKPDLSSDHATTPMWNKGFKFDV